MDFKKLIYFVSVAENLSYSKAAEKLHMSQPPLTYQIKLLEDALGVSLFKRTTRRVELTKAGEILLERARQILELIELTTEEIKQHQLEKKILKIGFVASSAALLSPKKLKAYHEIHGDVHFHLKEGSTYEVLDDLNHGLVDVGLVRTPFNGENYEITYLSDEPMIAVSLNQMKTSLKLEDLKDVPLVLDKRFKTLIMNSCIKEGFMPSIICEGEDSRSLLSWVESGLGVAILPYSGRKFMSEMLTYGLISSKALVTKSAIVRRKENVYEDYLEDFIGILKHPAE
ncbi:MAG: LysR family transcriptional regulator [Clostridia bacterium]|nr:LysR family transcriptional regulator [Clostridia bacterium]